MARGSEAAGSTVYNTLANVCLGPLHDGTVPERERQRVADALAMQLLVYDNLVCLSNDLSVTPILVKLVGLEYTCHLLKQANFRLIRARAVAALKDDQVLWVIPRGRGSGKYGKDDWARAAFASDAIEAADWVARRGVGDIGEPGIRSLTEAIIVGTTEIDPHRVLGLATEGLEEEIAEVNHEVMVAGHRRDEVFRLEERESGQHLVVAETDVDRVAVIRCVLNHVGRKADLVIPKLVTLDAQSTDVAIAYGGEVGAMGCGYSRPLADESRSVLEGVMQALNMPNVGELIRLGRITPQALVDLREGVECVKFRKWYAENVLPNPYQAVAEAAKLIASITAKSTPQRVIEFIMGQAASLAAGIAGLPFGGAGSLASGSVATMLHAALATRFADWLFKRRHPMKFVERLREVGRCTTL